MATAPNKTGAQKQPPAAAAAGPVPPKIGAGTSTKAPLPRPPTAAVAPPGTGLDPQVVAPSTVHPSPHPLDEPWDSSYGITFLSSGPAVKPSALEDILGRPVDVSYGIHADANTRSTMAFFLMCGSSNSDATVSLLGQLLAALLERCEFLDLMMDRCANALGASTFDVDAILQKRASCKAELRPAFAYMEQTSGLLEELSSVSSGAGTKLSDTERHTVVAQWMNTNCNVISTSDSDAKSDLTCLAACVILNDVWSDDAKAIRHAEVINTMRSSENLKADEMTLPMLLASGIQSQDATSTGTFGKEGYKITKRDSPYGLNQTLSAIANGGAAKLLCLDAGIKQLTDLCNAAAQAYEGLVRIYFVTMWYMSTRKHGLSSELYPTRNPHLLLDMSNNIYTHHLLRGRTDFDGSSTSGVISFPFIQMALTDIIHRIMPYSLTPTGLVTEPEVVDFYVKALPTTSHNILMNSVRRHVWSAWNSFGHDIFRYHDDARLNRATITPIDVSDVPKWNPTHEMSQLARYAQTCTSWSHRTTLPPGAELGNISSMPHPPISMVLGEWIRKILTPCAVLYDGDGTADVGDLAALNCMSSYDRALYPYARSAPIWPLCAIAKRPPVTPTGPTYIYPLKTRIESGFWLPRFTQLEVGPSPSPHSTLITIDAHEHFLGDTVNVEPAEAAAMAAPSGEASVKTAASRAAARNDNSWWKGTHCIARMAEARLPAIDNQLVRQNQVYETRHNQIIASIDENIKKAARGSSEMTRLSTERTAALSARDANLKQHKQKNENDKKRVTLCNVFCLLVTTLKPVWPDNVSVCHIIPLEERKCDDGGVGIQTHNSALDQAVADLVAELVDGQDDAEIEPMIPLVTADDDNNNNNDDEIHADRADTAIPPTQPFDDPGERADSIVARTPGLIEETEEEAEDGDYVDAAVPADDTDEMMHVVNEDDILEIPASAPAAKKKVPRKKKDESEAATSIKSKKPTKKPTKKQAGEDEDDKKKKQQQPRKSTKKKEAADTGASAIVIVENGKDHDDDNDDVNSEGPALPAKKRKYAQPKSKQGVDSDNEEESSTVASKKKRKRDVIDNDIPEDSEAIESADVVAKKPASKKKKVTVEELRPSTASVGAAAAKIQVHLNGMDGAYGQNQGMTLSVHCDGDQLNHFAALIARHMKPLLVGISQK